MLSDFELKFSQSGDVESVISAHKCNSKLLSSRSSRMRVLCQ